LRARNNTTGCWGNDRVINYTIIANPAAPATPTISSNTCGDKTLTRDTPTIGITWYWQGTNPSGTSTVDFAPTYNVSVSGTYYLRARDNTTLCWSSSTSAIVTINPLPSLPTTVNHGQVLGDGVVNLSVSGTSGNEVHWFDGQGATVNIGDNYSVYLNQTTSFDVKTFDGACFSSSSMSVTGTVITYPGVRIIGSSELPSGQTATLDVIGTYDTYQWKRNGINIVGATSASYVANQAGRYSSEITSNGTVAESPVISIIELDATPDGSVTSPVTIPSPDPNSSTFTPNYVRTFTARDAFDDTQFQSNLNNKDLVNTSTQYFDGLGRPIQTVVREASPVTTGAKDIVQQVEYDGFGRQVREYALYF